MDYWGRKSLFCTPLICIFIGDSNNDAVFEVYTTSLITTTRTTPSTSQNTWYHLVGTYDGTDAKLYINGEVKGTAIGSGNIRVSTTNVYIGQWGDGTARFNGLIDEVRIYNRALTAAEISDLYNNYGYTTTAYPGRVLVRKYASPEPSTTVYGEEWKDVWLDADGNLFDYRRPITISNSGSALTDYQILVTADTQSLISAGKMQSGCQDLRFVAIVGTDYWQLNHWIESGINTSATRIWVRIPSIPAGSSTIYAYYGNSGVSSASSGTATFDFFDDFEGTSLDADKWNATGGSYMTVSGGLLNINTMGSGGVVACIDLRNPSIASTPAQAEIKMRLKQEGSGRQTSVCVHNNNNYIGYIGWEPPKVVSTYYDGSKWTGGVTLYASPVTGVFYIYKIIHRSDDHISKLLDAQYGELGSVTRTGYGGTLTRLTTIGKNTKSESNLDIDWIRVRKYADLGAHHERWGGTGPGLPQLTLEWNDYK